MDHSELREFTFASIGLWADALGDLADAELRFADSEVLEAIARCNKSTAVTPLERIHATEALIEAEASAGIAIIDRMAARDQLRFLSSLS